MNNTFLIKKYFEQKSLVESDIKSFDYFVEKGMADVIKEVGEIVPTIIPQDVNRLGIL